MKIAVANPPAYPTTLGAAVGFTQLDAAALASCGGCTCDPRRPALPRTAAEYRVWIEDEERWLDAFELRVAKLRPRMGQP